MVFGILAGFSFMGTLEPVAPSLFWGFGMSFCLLRLLILRLDLFLPHHSRNTPEEAFTHELPERVSDAVILIGFGFAADSNHWLGLSTALAAIFSAYVRSIGMQRGANRRSVAIGPMTRSHRLILVSAASLLMMLGLPPVELDTSLPQIALWVILFGCITTILMRWFNIRDWKEE